MEKSAMTQAVALMESHRGRDKVLRTIGYVSCMIGGICHDKNDKDTSEKLFTISKEMGQCRTVLRLFDDLSMLASTLSYGTGKKDPDRVISILKNIVDQCFFPLEHIAWATDKGLINIDSSTPWWIASIATWTTSLTLGIIRSLRKYLRIRHMLKHNRDGDEKNTAKLAHAMKMESLTILKNCADLGNAINWMPPGMILWSGKLSQTSIGCLGTISSLIGLYQFLIAKK